MSAEDKPKNKGGRPKGSTSNPATAKLKKIAKKLETLSEEAVDVVVTLMRASDSKPELKKSCAQWVIATYVATHQEIERREKPNAKTPVPKFEEPEAPVQEKPTFSLTVVNGGKAKEYT